MSRRGAASFRPSSFPPAFLTPRFNKVFRNPTIAQTQTRLIRSIQKPIHKGARFNHDPRREVLKSSQAAAFARKVKAMPLRPGLLGYKRAMSAVYDAETGIRRPVTIIQLDRNQIVEHKTRRKHGYIAACMGCGAKSFGNLTRPVLGQYAAKGIPPSRDLVEFRVASEAGLPAVGTTINADWFSVGQYIDVKAKCRGMGFEGGMKRHGFRGQDASHGASLSHRSMGSAGQGQGGGSRVLPGKRMPGRMGGQSVSVQNLQVVRTDPENGLLVVAGAIPGPKKALIKISDALKKPWPEVPQAYAHLFATDGKAPSARADGAES